MKRPMLVLAIMAAGLSLAASAWAQRYAASEAFVNGDEISCDGVPPSAGIGEAPSRPGYPAASCRAKEEGKVRVGVCISAEGKANSVKLLQPPIRPEVLYRKYADPAPEPVEFTEFPRLRAAIAPYACNKPYTPMTDAKGKPVATCNVVIEYTWRIADCPPPEPVQDLAVQVQALGR